MELLFLVCGVYSEETVTTSPLPSIRKKVAMPDPEFQDQLARIHEGDRKVEAQILAGIQEHLWKHARRLLGRNLRRYVDSMDIVNSAQRSLLDCLRQGKYQFSSPARLNGMAWRILQRKVAHKARKMKQEEEIKEHLQTNGEHRSDAGDNPAETVAARELLHTIKEELGERDWKVLELHLQGYNAAEIAKELGFKSAGVARATKLRILERLAAKYPELDGTL